MKALGSIVLALAVVASAAHSAGAQSTAARVIDRTYSCSVTRHAGVRDVKVQVTTGTRWIEDRRQWKRLASAYTSDWVDSFGGLSAGNPLAPEESGYRFPPERFSVPVATKCKAAKRIAFTRRGLSGGPASPLTDTYACLPGSRAVIRVRGVFRAPTRLKLKSYSNGRFLTASGTIVRGEMGVWSQTGKPLAYAEVLESGKARILTADSCVAD